MFYKHNVAILSAAVFTVVAFAHLLRLVFQFDLSIGGEVIALWVNVFGALFAGYLVVANFRLVERRGQNVWLTFLAWLVLADAAVTFYSWLAGLSYWGISASLFGWITLFDTLLALVLFFFVTKKTSRTATP